MPEVITGQYGAGRCQKGDFKWEFNNAVDDASCDLNVPLKAALQAYKSSWIGFFDGTSIPTGINQSIVNRKSSNRQCYNLNGQKVGDDYKGIVIMNGKKVVIK